MAEIDVKRMKPWTWEMFEPGIAAPPSVVHITREVIANYARSVHNTNPIYFDDQAAREEGYEQVAAPPTMAFVYAPNRRIDIFNTRGYLSPEQTERPRTTAFVGAEFTFLGVPIYPGDTITSVTTVDHTWESRSGNKFVAFRIVGNNQRGMKVCDYLYNIIWEYARGQKGRE